MDLLISFCSQFSIIQWISYFRVLMSFTDGSLVDSDEQLVLDEFSNIVTNSSEAIIGRSCGTGGVFLLCVLIYIPYRLLRDDPIVHPTTGPDPPANHVTLNTNQNGASCPHCGPPRPYNQVVTMGECADLCTCMSASPANSKPTNWLNKKLLNWRTESQTDRVTDWLTDCLPACLTDWLNER